MYSASSRPYVVFAAEHNLHLHGMFPATVVGIDGKPVNAGATPPVAPGMHAIEVEMRLQHDAGQAIRKTLEVNAEPCMRYYIASREVGQGRFEPVVATTEPIKECQKLPQAKASGGM